MHNYDKWPAHNSKEHIPTHFEAAAPTQHLDKYFMHLLQDKMN
jgi:hypothetical protein